MKAQIGLLVPVEVAELLRHKATELGVSQPTLVGFALRFLADKCPPEALRAWAARNQPALGRKPAGGGGLTARERKVLDAFVGLHTNGAGAWRFDTLQVGGAAGIRPVEALGALYGLQSKGLVHVTDLQPGATDRWNRPIGLVWTRIDLLPDDLRARLGLVLVPVP